MLINRVENRATPNFVFNLYAINTYFYETTSLPTINTTYLSKCSFDLS